jgi:hypothetical protein
LVGFIGFGDVLGWVVVSVCRSDSGGLFRAVNRELVAQVVKLVFSVKWVGGGDMGS